MTAVESFCVVSDAERTALLSPRRPIVVLRRRPDAAISPAVAPGNDTIGVMLPYTPLHYLLFSDSPDDPPQFTALVMTSGNISEEPIVTSNEEAWERLQSSGRLVCVSQSRHLHAHRRFRGAHVRRDASACCGARVDTCRILWIWVSR